MKTSLVLFALVLGILFLGCEKSPVGNNGTTLNEPDLQVRAYLADDSLNISWNSIEGCGRYAVSVIPGSDRSLVKPVVIWLGDFSPEQTTAVLYYPQPDPVNQPTVRITVFCFGQEPGTTIASGMLKLALY